MIVCITNIIFSAGSCSDNLKKKLKMNTMWKVSVFRVFLVRIFPHSDWIRRETEYSVQMRENTNQKNSEYGHFSRSGNETRIRVQSCPGIWILDFLPQFRAEAGFLYVKKCLLEITQISLITWVISLQRNSLSFFITL